MASLRLVATRSSPPRSSSASLAWLALSCLDLSTRSSASLFATTSSSSRLRMPLKEFAAGRLGSSSGGGAAAGACASSLGRPAAASASRRASALALTFLSESCPSLLTSISRVSLFHFSSRSWAWSWSARATAARRASSPGPCAPPPPTAPSPDPDLSFASASLSLWLSSSLSCARALI